VCKCNPLVRTPYCGKQGCEFPPQAPMCFRVYRIEATHVLMSGQPIETKAKVSFIADQDGGALMDLQVSPLQAERFRMGELYDIVPHVPAGTSCTDG
jgi:hypothetical protein